MSLCDNLIVALWKEFETTNCKDCYFFNDVSWIISYNSGLCRKKHYQVGKCVYFKRTKMKNCERCVYFGGYTGYCRAGCREYMCSCFPAGKCQLIYVKKVCKNYKENEVLDERKEMFKTGDRVKSHDGSFSEALVNGKKEVASGASFNRKPVTVVLTNLNEPSHGGQVSDTLIYCEGNYYLVQQRFLNHLEPTIEITCKVNGKVSTLKAISEETLLGIRNQS